MMASVPATFLVIGLVVVVDSMARVLALDEADSMLVVAQGMAGSTQAQALAEVDNIPVVAQGVAGNTQAQALAEGDNIPVRAQGVAGNTQAQALAEDKAGRQADGILALGKDEDMAQGMVDRLARDTALGVVGTLGGGTQAQGQVQQQAQDEVQE